MKKKTATVKKGMKMCLGRFCHVKAKLRVEAKPRGNKTQHTQGHKHTHIVA